MSGRSVLVSDGFRTVGAADPGRPALEEGGRRLTFGALAERIDRLGTAVRHGLGLEAGAHAAILAPNCLEYVELVGIWGGSNSDERARIRAERRNGRDLVRPSAL